MQPPLKVLLLYCCAGLMPLPIESQTGPASVQSANFQNWGELDASTRLWPHLDVTWIARGEFSAQVPNPAIYLFGTDWNVGAGRRIVITPSYHVWGYHTAMSGSGHGQSPILGVMPTFSRVNSLCLTGIASAGGLSPTEADRHGTTEIARKSCTRSVIRSGECRSSHQMKPSTPRNTEAGRETGLRPASAKS